MLEYLGSQETLEAWQSKSLAERAALFNAKFTPVTVSASTLRNAYKKLGIKKKKVQHTKAVPEKSLPFMRRQTRFA